MMEVLVCTRSRQSDVKYPARIRTVVTDDKRPKAVSGDRQLSGIELDTLNSNQRQKEAVECFSHSRRSHLNILKESHTA